MEYKETKANKAISFWHFIQEHTVEIPIIQRDYAQGRLGKEYLRKTFLESLKQALDEGREALKLDFVYGSKENGKLQPLDGQQRLTTLWLLHWYVALRAGKLDEVVKGQERICDVLRNFTYETRISSREFCGCLCNADNFKTFDGKDIVGFITSQTWFYSVWKQDPTIQSMLRMLGGTKINNKAGEDITDGMEELFDGTDKFDEYWDSLSSDCSPIIFYYLPLNDFGLSDDLYVKMNARGKQLTSFENFKADLLGYIASQAEEDKKWEKFLDPENGIAIKLDTTWTDLFWQESRDNKIDEIYFAFLNRFFLNWIMLRNSSEKNIETDKTYKYLYGDDSKYGSFDIYKFEELYDVLNHLTETLNHFAASCCENSKISGNKFDKIKAASLPSWKENDDFYFIPQYKESTITTLERDQRVVFHAVCKYFEIGTYDESSFKRWMRVVWNIVENSNATLIGCLKLIDEIGEHCHDVYAFLADNNTIVKSDAAKEQLAEETEKAKQILKKDYSGNIEEFNGKTWEDVISEAEKYAFFKGAIRFLFLNNSGEWDWSDFDTKWKNLKKSVTSTKEDRNVIYHMISFFNDEDIKTIFTGYDLSNDDNNLRGIFVKYASKMHNFLMNVLYAAQLALVVDTGDALPAVELGGLSGGLGAGSEVVVVLLVDIRLGVGHRLPAAEVGHRQMGGHIQPDHLVGTGQTHALVLQIKEPVEKPLPLVLRQLGGLMHGVGGGVTVHHHQSSGLVIGPPLLLVPGVPVHSKEGGGGIGVDIVGVGAKGAPQIHPHQGRGFLPVAGIDGGTELPPRLIQCLTAQLKLGGLSRAVRSLKHDQFSSHGADLLGHTYSMYQYSIVPWESPCPAKLFPFRSQMCK